MQMFIIPSTVTLAAFMRMGVQRTGSAYVYIYKGDRGEN